MASLKTRNVAETRQIRAFFDAIATDYRECHGDALNLLRYRLSVIEPLLGDGNGTLLDIGCGSGIHLLELAGRYRQAIGIDLSPAMIEVARKLSQQHSVASKITLAVDSAEHLSTIADGQIDTVLCVGALEHIPDQTAVCAQVWRVLKPGGRLVCLTPNGQYCWYRSIARWLRLETRHLSSDRFLSLPELSELLDQAGMAVVSSGYWSFIPKGDMPTWLYWPLFVLDRVGRLLDIALFRGGIYVAAVKPDALVNRSDE